ncbi:MAG: 4'-phosphopantetheinyl transferase superfamily protein [Ignavibacteria bacterium]
MENEIHVYKIRFDKSEDEISRLTNLLSDDELEKAKKYKFKKLSDNYITARGTLRKILGRYLKVLPSIPQISYKEKGKPFIKNDDIKFNLAHTKDIAVYAFTKSDEIGIDVERIREMPDALQIANRFFSLDEYIALKEINNEQMNYTFFNCWTRKESFIKAIGEGLTYPLENFSVSSKPGDEPRILWLKNKENEVNHWALHNVEIGNEHIASLSIRNKNKKIVYLDCP